MFVLKIKLKFKNLIPCGCTGISILLNFCQQAASGRIIPAAVTYERPSTSRGGRGRGGKRGGRRGGGDYSDDDDGDVRDAPRPSGPASLFDFFDAKLNERNGLYLKVSCDSLYHLMLSNVFLK